MARQGSRFRGCDDVQLFEFNAGKSVVLFEGHLDNRQEILRSLSLVSGAVSSDAQLLQLAWQQWGENCLTQWEGRFACILWDGGTRQLILGCDVLGKRQLHHWQGREQYLFASEPRGLLAQAPVTKAFDQTHIAEILALIPPNPTSCIFANIQKLPPGYLLIVQAEKLRLHRYWQPENLPYLRLSKPEEYAEALRAALVQAVACRLPPNGLVGCYLSAGLDSPSVATIAAQQLEAQGRQLVAFTAVPPLGFVDQANNPSQIYDEGPLAALVAARHSNIEHVKISNNSLSFFEAMDIRDLSADWPGLGATNARWIMATGQEIKQRGISVMLTGNLGNIGLSYDGMLAPAALLRQGRLFDLLPILIGLILSAVVN